MPSRPIALVVPDIGEIEYSLVMEVLRSGYLSSGGMLKRFESDFASRVGARHAIAVSSGTAALHLSMIAAGVGDDDIVITTPFSFVASSNAILYQRGIPLFVDVDPHTLTIDPEKTIEAIDAVTHRRQAWEKLLPRKNVSRRGKLKAVLPVHIFGRPVEMRAIMDAARSNGIAVVEDACEAIGAESDGVAAGRWGDAGVFAFYPNKQMTTGEGGMIVTDDDRWAQLITSLRSQGRSEESDWLRHEHLGYNYRLDEMSAAIGVAQLARLDELLQKRAEVAQAYERRLRDVDGVEPMAPPRASMTLSWFLYPIRLRDGIDRDGLMDALAARGVPSRPYFWPIHLQPFYMRQFDFRTGDFPHAEAAGRSLLSLPFHTHLTRDEIEYVVSCVQEEVEAACLARRT